VAARIKPRPLLDRMRSLAPGAALLSVGMDVRRRYSESVGTLLGSIRVMPLSAQVVVEEEGASDLPTPETGEERAVASTQCVLVATRGDREGDVMMDVWRGADLEWPGEVVLDGETQPDDSSARCGQFARQHAAECRSPEVWLDSRQGVGGPT
jgi:hypothetical protein